MSRPPIQSEVEGSFVVAAGLPTWRIPNSTHPHMRTMDINGGWDKKNMFDNALSFEKLRICPSWYSLTMRLWLWSWLLLLRYSCILRFCGTSRCQACTCLGVLVMFETWGAFADWILPQLPHVAAPNTPPAKIPTTTPSRNCRRKLA